MRAQLYLIKSRAIKFVGASDACGKSAREPGRRLTMRMNMTVKLRLLFLFEHGDRHQN
jgi:hypothetical protein